MTAAHSLVRRRKSAAQETELLVFQWRGPDDCRRFNGTPSPTEAINGYEATERSLKNGHPEYLLSVLGEPQVVSSIFYSCSLTLADYFGG
jgi:hypothetical protein